MTIATVVTLFPPNPLAILALDFRYTSLAGLMRNISSQIGMPEVNQSRQNILDQELIVMPKRMVMVKYSLFLAGMSFILNLCALFASYYGHQEANKAHKLRIKDIPAKKSEYFIITIILRITVNS